MTYQEAMLQANVDPAAAHWQLQQMYGGLGMAEPQLRQMMGAPGDIIASQGLLSGRFTWAGMQNVAPPDPRTPLQRLRDYHSASDHLTWFHWNRWRLTPVGAEYTPWGRAWGWYMAVIYTVLGLKA